MVAAHTTSIHMMLHHTQNNLSLCKIIAYNNKSCELHVCTVPLQGHHKVSDG
jgi:hypothetical protein